MIGSSPMIQGRGTARFLLPHGTMINVADALYAPRANRTLLSFKDIRANGYHLETHCQDGKDFLCVTSQECGRKRVLEKLPSQSSGLYLTTIRLIESYAVTKHDLWDSDSYRLWHDRLGHPGRDMMIRILRSSHGHPFFRSKRQISGLSNAAESAAHVAARTRSAMHIAERANGASTSAAMRPEHTGHDAVRTMSATCLAVHNDLAAHSFARILSAVRTSAPADAHRATDCAPEGTNGRTILIAARHPPPESSLALSDAHRSFCRACSLAKLQSKPSYAKANTENIPFLQRIQGDICGPIHPTCGQFQ